VLNDGGTEARLARRLRIGHVASMEKRMKSDGVSRTEVAIALAALGSFVGIFMLGVALRRLIQ
jgi:hypothetical protein